MQTTSTTQKSPQSQQPKSQLASYTIDASHSNATFSVRHMMISNVRGEFQKLEGLVAYDPARPEATTIAATIDVASVNTREPKRDDHLRSADFFDVANYPTITFVSRPGGAKKTAKGLELKGDLTIRGVTREVLLEVEGPTSEQKDPWGNVRLGASATTKINRTDFGMTFNSVLDTGGVLVGEEISITLDVELVRT